MRCVATSGCNIDIHVMDPDTQSNQHHVPKDVLTTVEKKSKYIAACEERRVGFTPLSFLLDGIIKFNTDFFVTPGGTSAELVRKKKQPSDGLVEGLFVIAILQAVILHIRGSCTKWRSLENRCKGNLPLVVRCYY